MKRRKGYCNIDDECFDCSENISPYGCTWHECGIYQELEQGRIDEHYDDVYKESRIHPIFNEVLKQFMGGNK